MELLYKYSFAFVALLIGLLLNELLLSLINGILFYIDREFVEGDIIIKENNQWIIINIGFQKTILYCKELDRWRFIKNDSIRKDLERDSNKNQVPLKEIKTLRLKYNKTNKKILE